MKSPILCVVALYSSFGASALAAQPPPVRPRITKINVVRIFVSDYCKSLQFYDRLLTEQPHDCALLKGASGGSFVLNNLQFMGVNTMSSTDLANRLEEIGFTTDDLAALRRYFAFYKISIREQGRDTIAVTDPEGHAITFTDKLAEQSLTSPAMPRAFQIIHAGFVVHDRAAMDKFYKDILGFHVYWHGGMKDDQTDWLDMQIPDGTDWIEYMLNVPANADKHTLGVMNHVALGVPDIHAAAKQLLTNGMKLTEEPKIGRDGKWQLNLYDPDQTRVELMEFVPVQKPCCSEYTGPHPTP
jgi:catechol 2,3-dioxygenase-like lactoylglutathione lyase family enzyme